MIKYPYSKELPNPVSLANLNFESKLVSPFLEIYRRALKKQLKQKKIPKFKIGHINCYQIGPDNEAILPAIIWYHGGGFLFPLQTTVVRIGNYYSQKLNCRVFFPEYRLIPEHPFPAAFNDCYEAYQYLYKHAEEYKIDRENIVLVGDSAGGCLASVVCQKLRDEGNPLPKAQMLYYPVTDHSMDYESFETYKMAVWSKNANYHMWNLYLKKDYRNLERYISPMQNGRFDHLPNTYIEVCEMDTLKDEGTAYASKLMKAGVNVTFREIKGAYHAYDVNFHTAFVQRELEQIINFLKEQLKIDYEQN